MTPCVSLILAMVVFGATISLTLSGMGLRESILTPWKLLVFGASFAIQYLLFSLALSGILMDAAILAGHESGPESVVCGFFCGWVYFLAVWVTNCIILAIFDAFKKPEISTKWEDEE